MDRFDFSKEPPFYDESRVTQSDINWFLWARILLDYDIYLNWVA